MLNNTSQYPAVTSSYTVWSTKKRNRRRGRRTLPHVAKNKFGEWVGAKPNPHPVVIVGVSVSGDGYKQLEIPEPISHEPTNVSIELFQMTSDQLLVHRDLLKERLADNLKELQEVLRLMQLMRRACSLEEEEKFIDVQTEVRNLWY